MLKIALFAIVLSSLVGCGSSLPPFPPIWQCGYDYVDTVFRCVNTDTKEHKLLSAYDPSMQGAQCLSLEDYKSSEAWVAAMKEIAQKRCQ